ncbi:hypothetical protein [Nocardioides sp.]|uniref:hypothetical protein n=1 Tax=Nocardioides sp. TaxID=35761 RepID=UPI003567DD6C
MTRRVFLHIGLPKTGTTYLQSILWAHRAALREAGLLLPGRGPREHLWASCDVRGENRLERRHADAPGSWARLAAEVNTWQRDALITHEFFCGASADQIGAALQHLEDAEVHVVITAREVVSLVTARWQEWVKNGATGAIDDYPTSEAYDPTDEWGWSTLDLADILRRWSTHVAPERIHVICPPQPQEGEDALWERFAAIVGVAPTLAQTSSARPNRSLGLVAIELMRRVNVHAAVKRPVDRGVWLRGYLAEDVLAELDTERFWPSAARVEVLRERGRLTLEALAAGGYDVQGESAVLATPETLEPRRHPAEVTDAEVVDVAARAMARMLADVREARAADGVATQGPAPRSERFVTLARRAVGRRRTRG